MIKLKYKSGKANAPKLTLVGKGVMYDSGGISLKPSDAVHATMKTDMSGAGNILAAMSALSALECPTDVTSYLMCTDNMPSGTALKLGDVMTIRGGTTVEVINTDAEGRLMLADGLVLATEEPTDAIIDMATLTGACMMALGTMIGGVLGNNQPLIDQLMASANTTDEPLWQLPLSPLYRRDISSEIADIKNMGGKTAGAITAALFLNEFVGNTPWAHIDIAGTAQNDVPELWRTKGASGFGTRMILDAAINFKAPKA
jgi:leucyl aminopeptidase